MILPGTTHKPTFREEDATTDIMLHHPSWVDEDGNWNPPLPEKSTWKKGAPEELDAAIVMGEAWVTRHSLVRIPRDIARVTSLLNTEPVVSISAHAQNVVMPGAKHENVLKHFERIDEVLEHATLIGSSQAKELPDEAVRWEVYTSLPDGSALLTILETGPSAPSGEVVSFYMIGKGSFENRKAKTVSGEPYLKGRESR